VGKTTCAAALAVQSAKSRRTLLVSTDPASSLGDVLDARVGRSPRPVRGIAGLDAANVDAQAAFKAWLAPRRGTIASIALRGSYLDQEDVARLLRLSLPGAGEILALVGVLRVAARGAYDRVVVDTAPTGHTLRLLTSRALLTRAGRLLDALQSHHRQVVTALRGYYDGDRGDALIQELDRDGRMLDALLRDRRRTHLWWVSLPEPMALEETADAFEALRARDVGPPDLILNRMTPAAPCEWCRARRTVEARAITPVLARFRDVAVRFVPDLAGEPRGRHALMRIARLFRKAAGATPGAPPIPRRLSAFPPRAVRCGRTIHASSVLRRDLQFVLFGGKGGVGKSTCAAAYAVDLARHVPSRRILLLSTDPAHSLADVFGTPLGDVPAPVDPALKNLHAREIDAESALAAFRSQYVDSVDEVVGAFTRAGSGDADRTALRQLLDVAPPDIDEVIAIADLASALTASRAAYDTIVADTAPTGHALRLLQTPAVLREWLQASMAILLKYREMVQAGALGHLLVDSSRRLRTLMALLHDSRRTQLVLVTRAAALPIAETLRFSRALSAHRISIGAVVVNAVGGGTCRPCRRRAEIENAQVARILRASRADARRVIATAATMPPPHGARVLGEWSAAWTRVQ